MPGGLCFLDLFSHLFDFLSQEYEFCPESVDLVLENSDVFFVFFCVLGCHGGGLGIPDTVGYTTPEEFSELRRQADALGFRHVASGALVRSSYHADEQYEAAASGVAV